MTEFFTAVPQPVAPASAPAGDGLRYLVYDPQRVVAGRTMAEHLRIAVCYWHSFNWPGSDVFGAGTFDRPWLAVGADPMQAAMALLESPRPIRWKISRWRGVRLGSAGWWVGVSGSCGSRADAITPWSVS